MDCFDEMNGGDNRHTDHIKKRFLENEEPHRARDVPDAFRFIFWVSVTTFAEAISHRLMIFFSQNLTDFQIISHENSLKVRKVFFHVP